MNATVETSAPVELATYDPTWPEKYAAEREVLEQLLRPWIAGPIEHVGSTAVPGLLAKPVIDIMVAVESLDASQGAIPAATRAQYIYWPYKSEVMHWFCKPSDAYRTHHLHLISYRSQLWNDRIFFRDSLRKNRELAQQYARLKASLAKQFRNDREAYTEGKTDFVQGVLSAM